MTKDDGAPRRAYRSPRRREQALETRRRMLTAAGRLLAAHGYAGTTIAAVARDAGVAVETVYAAFGSKRGLVGALVQASVRGDEAAPAAAQAGAAAVAAASDQREQVRLFAADVCVRLERVGPVLQALAAAAEPELAELLGNVDRNRLEGMRAFVAALERHGPLRVDADTATQTTWALASPELRQLLVQRGGWSQERYCDWLGDTLAAALLR